MLGYIRLNLLLDNSCHLCSATGRCSFKSLLPPSLCPAAFMLLACAAFIISGCRLRGGTCRLRYQLRLCLYVCYQAFSTLCNIALPLLSACLQFFVWAYLPHWSYIQLLGSCPYACNHLVLTCLCLLLLGNYFLPIALALSVKLTFTTLASCIT